MIPNKIYIIGPAGSGKSFLAKRLHIYSNKIDNKDYQRNVFTDQQISSQFPKKQLPILDLDDIFWAKKYTRLNIPQKQRRLLQHFLQANQKIGWIIEGASPNFSQDILVFKPKIIWLNPPLIILLYRLTKRFILKNNFIQNKRFLLNKYKPGQITKTSPEKLANLYKLYKGVIGYKMKDNLYKTHKKIANDNKI